MITLKKADYFLQHGRYANRLGFIKSGIIRKFVWNKDKEITKWIATQGYFVVDINSFYFGNTARWNLQALTDCELYVIEKDNYKNLESLIPQWPTLEKHFIAKCFAV